MDQSGHWVVWLTENTPENQARVFAQNPDLLEDDTVFKTADFSLVYLTDLLANISAEMGTQKLPFVTLPGFPATGASLTSNGSVSPLISSPG